MKFTPRLLATAIGSLPYEDPKLAARFILDRLKEAPAWPQLPKKSFNESMYVQFSESLPCLKIDVKRKKFNLDTAGDTSNELSRFYERFLAGDLEYFAVSEKYAAGLYAFVEELKTRPREGLQFLKGQLTGPISFGLSVADQNKRAVLYNSELADVLVKNLVMKARWQIKALKQLHPEIIIFIDEPYLVSIGSSYVSLNRDDVISKLDEVIEAVHSEGAVAGIHCCGNTDWSLLTETKTDIISFDAYDYSEPLSLFAEAIRSFFERGGSLAWGIVPSFGAIERENLESLEERTEEAFKLLINKGLKKEDLLEKALITPSCGAGSLPKEQAERSIELTSLLSKRLKEKCFR